MKKLFALLLAMVLLISMTACGKDKAKTDKTDDPKETEAAGQSAQSNKVTIYLPKSEEQIESDGSKITTVYTYEEGWQEKDTFTVTSEIKNGERVEKTTMTFSNGKMVSTYEYDGTTSTYEVYYDENGRAAKTVMPIETINPDNTVVMGSVEVVNTYDDKGRIIREDRTSKMDGQEPTTLTTNYTYKDTAEGSEGWDDQETTVEDPNNLMVAPTIRTVRVYNKDNWLIKEISMMGEQEISRTEYTYNEHGIQTSMRYYMYDTLNFTANITLEAVEVSPEKAQQLPMFKGRK